MVCHIWDLGTLWRKDRPTALGSAIPRPYTAIHPFVPWPWLGNFLPPLTEQNPQFLQGLTQMPVSSGNFHWLHLYSISTSCNNMSPLLLHTAILFLHGTLPHRNAPSEVGLPHRPELLRIGGPFASLLCPQLPAHSTCFWNEGDRTMGKNTGVGHSNSPLERFREQPGGRARPRSCGH